MVKPKKIFSRRKRRTIFGSARSSYFIEPKTSGRTKSPKKRPQRIRLRVRALLSSIRDFFLKVWLVTKVALFIGGVVGGVWGGMKFWNESNLIRVSEILLAGDIPPTLVDTLGIQPGQNIFLIRPQNLEEIALENFLELKQVTIHRTFYRQVKITGKYRTPIATILLQGQLFGVDNEGRTIPLFSHNALSEPRPHLEGTLDQENIVQISQVLFEWENQVPEFYSRIIRLKTDSINTLNVELKSGVLIEWEPWEFDTIREGANHILRLLHQYKPTGDPAILKVVTVNRIVMNKNWKPR